MGKTKHPAKASTFTLTAFCIFIEEELQAGANGVTQSCIVLEEINQGIDSLLTVTFQESLKRVEGISAF